MTSIAAASCYPAWIFVLFSLQPDNSELHFRKQIGIVYLVIYSLIYRIRKMLRLIRDLGWMPLLVVEKIRVCALLSRLIGCSQ